MKKKGVIIGTVILIISFFFLWNFFQYRPQFVVYGFHDDYKRSFFLIYGHRDGAELKYIDDRYYVRLDPATNVGVARIKNDIPTKEYIHYFLNLSTDVSIYQKRKFSNNGIHFFQDTALGNEGDFKGIISFYIGDTSNPSTYVMHMQARDSIIQSLE